MFECSASPPDLCR